MLNGLLRAPSRSHTPLSSNKLRNHHGASQVGGILDSEQPAEDDPQILRFKTLYEQSEARITSLFDSFGNVVAQPKRKAFDAFDATHSRVVAQEVATSLPVSKKRKLDDNYDDYDDDDEEDEEDEDDTASATSPLKAKSTKVQIISDQHASPVPRPVIPSRPASDASKSESAKQKEKPEDARKKLEETKRQEIETVRSMSRHYFFTLENDRDAMLDQQRLDEAERRAEAEAEGNAKGQNAAQQQGSLSNANLGASSLTLKNLIARIDQRRSVVEASESELRALMSEVRKNRSKWASEDKVGQEELYEAAEKVLNELKAQTEHSGPFLQPVKKKDAPDYHLVVKAPMDLGTMTKKLKQLAFKSKQEFCEELHIIWTNCLKYNSAPEHPMRKHALFMRKETDKLVPLIPEIVIRDRAEIEAEERRQRIANGEFDDNAEDSDDDQPIMASRGRAAPGSKKTSKTTQAVKVDEPAESTPVPETKPFSLTSQTNGQSGDSEIDLASQDNSTPPPGNLTPGLEKGAGSVIDAASEMPDSEISSLPFVPTPPEAEDDDYRLWKQKTKKDRATVAAARHKLFRGDKLNSEEDALLRSKGAMRRWQQLQPGQASAAIEPDLDESRAIQRQRGPTFADGLDPDEEESLLPDYYELQAAIPALNSQLRWENDVEGNVIEQNADYLRLYPAGQYVAPSSKLTNKMAENMRQIQETRKIVSKIGVVKQMSLQTQIYQNQFTKYEPAPFYEVDVKDHVMTDDGPLMAPWVAKAALTRSIGQVFFHAGFEEFQPSAIEAVADMASEFFQNLCSNLGSYLSQEKVPASTANPIIVAPGQHSIHRLGQEQKTALRPAFTSEEAMLHVLNTAGLSLNDIDYYAQDEMERMSTRLQTMYDRMRAHYAELLKPAMNDDTATGSGQFETGEQYVGGDFADDLGEDFFGFKELGLDREFGLVNLSVPLHLLHNRLSTAAHKSNDNGDVEQKLFIPPPAYPRVNVETIENEIGLVREFFKKRIKENGDRPLPEDLDLPVKQRKGFGRARIPATGKIGDGKVGTSPQKKLPGPSKADNKTVNKLTFSNGVKRNDSFASNSAQDTPMGDADGPDDIIPLSPSRQENGVNMKPQKTPNRPPLKQRPSNARRNSQNTDRLDMNGETLQNGQSDTFDSFVNGMDSPPPSANGGSSGDRKKGNKKADGDGDGGMISPASL